MTETTDCWLAFYGSVGEEIGPSLLRYMLGAPSELERRVRAKVAEEIEPILKDLRKAAFTHHYAIACRETDAALARLRESVLRSETTRSAEQATRNGTDS
jgi:hypothetical protein